MVRGDKKYQKLKDLQLQKIAKKSKVCSHKKC